MNTAETRAAEAWSDWISAEAQRKMKPLATGRTIDLRERCKRCNKPPRGKNQTAEYKRYAPFCSYDCQERFRVEEGMRHLRSIHQ